MRAALPPRAAALALLVLLLPAVIAAAKTTATAGAGAGAASSSSPAAAALTAAAAHRRNITTIPLPSPTHAGYLDLANGRGEMYYMYYEAEQPDDPSLKTTPIVLWLQGGPGCSSLFGAFYINGPYLVNADLSLRPNPGRWNRKYGTLYVDQPLGVGFSRARDPQKDIPAHELPLAADLFLALNAFYAARGQDFAQRPLFVTGESYAGKYVPSIAHYILQAHARSEGYEHELRHPRRLSPGAASAAPKFPYGGCAIGNGFTDAVTQTLVQAEVAHNMGLIDWRQRERTEALQRKVVVAVRDRRFRHARALSDQVLKLINEASGLGTLEDVRREKGYDAEDRVGRLLNLPAVRKAVGVREEAAVGGEGAPGADSAHNAEAYESCSPLVDRIMGADVMHSTAKLVPDLLAHGHVMLYHGQFDGECGSRSNEAWMETLIWPGNSGFRSTNRTRWWGGVVEEEARKRQRGSREAETEEGGLGGGGDGGSDAPPPPPEPLPNAHSGFLKSHMRLTHYVVRNAGHMVPHDRPEVGRALIEEWVDGVLSGKWEEEEEGGRGAAAAAARVLAPGRRPPPLAGPWAGWGSRGVAFDDDPYYALVEQEHEGRGVAAAEAAEAAEAEAPSWSSSSSSSSAAATF